MSPRLATIPFAELTMVDVLTLIDAARIEVRRLCEVGQSPWRMSIPVQITDSDVVIGDALAAAYRFIVLNTPPERDGEVSA